MCLVVGDDRESSRRSTASTELLIFAGVVALQLGYLFTHRLSWGTQRAAGMPTQDAYYWHQQALSLISGHGLTSALRAGYSIFLSLLFVWIGPSILAAQIAQVVLKGVAIVALYRIGVACLGHTLALLCAASMALNANFIDTTLSLLTENLGTTAVVLSFAAFVGFAETRRPSLAFLCGLALGVNEVSRPALTLWVPCAVVSCYLACREQPRPWRRGSVAAAAFLAGVLAVVGPWVARQHHAYGIWTVSQNTAETLYAATSPKYGRWTGEVAMEAAQAQIVDAKGNVDFFTAKTIGNLKRYPRFYVRNVLTNLVTFYGFPGRLLDNVRQHLVHLLLAFAVCAALAARTRGLARVTRPGVLLGLASAMAASIVLFAHVPIVLSLGGLVSLAALSPRRLWVPLITLSGCIGLTVAAFGMGDHDPRLTLMYTWLFVLGQVALAAVTVTWCVDATPPWRLIHTPAPVRDVIPPTRRTGRRMLVAAVTVILVASAARLISRHLTPEPIPVPPTALSAETRVATAAEVRGTAPYAFGAADTFAVPEPQTDAPRNHRRLLVDRGTVDAVKYEIPPAVAGARPDFESLFGQRSYRYTMLRIISSTYGSVNVVFPGAFSESVLGRPVLVVGRLNIPSLDHVTRNGLTAEGIAIQILDPSTFAVLRTRYARQPAHVARLRELAAAAGSGG